MSEASDPTTTDAFLGGLVTLMQPRKGHRAGLDAALLQAAVPADAAGLAVDFGTGAGAVAFSIAARAPGLRVNGVDDDESMLELGLRALSLRENAGFADRVRLLRADIGALSQADPDLAVGAADWVVMNPPFDDAGTVRESPAAGKRKAYLAAAGDLEGWIAAALTTLKRRGQLALIHRAAALPHILAVIRSGFGEIRVLPVMPHEKDPASRIVLCATSGSRSPFHLLPPLVLHGPDGAWTPEARRILNGESGLAF